MGPHKPEFLNLGENDRLEGRICGRLFGKAVPSQNLSKWAKEEGNKHLGV